MCVDNTLYFSKLLVEFILRLATRVGTIVLLLSVTTILYRVFILQNFSRLGPIRFPVLGNFPQIILGITHSDLPTLLLKWCKRYGRLFQLDLGSYSAIVLTDAKLIRKAFTSSLFSGRPRMLLTTTRMKQTPRGILMNDGKCWEEQRNLFSRKLREYGENNGTMESLIISEAQKLISLLQKNDNQPISTALLFNTAMINVMWSILAGEKYDYDDPRLRKIVASLVRSVSETGSSGLILFLPKLAKVFPKLSGWDEQIKAHNTTREFVKEFVNLRLSIDNSNYNDFTSTYIEQMNNTKNETSSFYKDEGIENLITTLDDLLLAGGETVGVTLTWLFLCLALYPETQQKFHAEIDEVIGRERPPVLTDRLRMKYAEAVINEVLRVSSVGVIGIPHRCIEDTVFGDIPVPRNTVVISNIDGVHHDPELWNEPNRYYPERFLTKELEKDPVSLTEKFIPFSAGKRRCPGEALAKAEIFLVGTAILQRFVVNLDPSTSKPTLAACYNGFIKKPKPHTLAFLNRSSVC